MQPLIGFSRHGRVVWGLPATPAGRGFTSCAADQISSSGLDVPAAGTGDPLNNSERVAPRHLFDPGLCIDNLLRTHGNGLRLRVSVINLTNREALYYFLSTFSGTYFVAPRTYQMQVGWLDDSWCGPRPRAAGVLLGRWRVQRRCRPTDHTGRCRGQSTKAWAACMSRGECGQQGVARER